MKIDIQGHQIPKIKPNKMTPSQLTNYINSLNLNREYIYLDGEDLDRSPLNQHLIEIFDEISGPTIIFLLHRLNHPEMQNYLLKRLADPTLLYLLTNGYFNHLSIFDAFKNPIPAIFHVVHHGDQIQEFDLFQSLIKRDPHSIPENLITNFLLMDLPPYIMKGILHFVHDQYYLVETIKNLNRSDILYQVLDRIENPELLIELQTFFKDPSIRTQIAIRRSKSLLDK